MRSISAPRAALAPITAIVLAATVGAAAIASPAGAQVVPGGTLVFSGTADASELGSPGVLLDFYRHVTADPLASDGIFAALDRNGKGAIGSIETVTVGNGPQHTRKVVHFGPYKFDLEYVPSGAYGQDDCYVAPEVGQRCTPYQLPSYELSPFYLENVASASSDAMFTALVSFDVAGSVTAHGRTSPFTGTLTAMFEGLSYQEALVGLEQYGMEDVPFTGTFVVGDRVVGDRVAGARAAPLATATTVTPEPTTATLMAIGLAGVVTLARRRRR